MRQFETNKHMKKISITVKISINQPQIKLSIQNFHYKYFTYYILTTLRQSFKKIEMHINTKKFTLYHRRK